jgi:hypothetical protein
MQTRLEWHNHGRLDIRCALDRGCPAVVIEFCDEATAVRFEKALKSGSGRAFAKRHFAPSGPV